MRSLAPLIAVALAACLALATMMAMVIYQEQTPGCIPLHGDQQCSAANGHNQ